MAGIRRPEWTFENVKFESFVKIREELYKNDGKAGVTLRYDGNDICGHMEVVLGYIHDEKKAEIFKIVTENIEFFG